MSFGLSNETVDQIRSVFARHPEVRQAILYGSRAMGTHRDASDIDLTLTGQDLNLAILARIETELDDLLLPWQFDLSIRSQIKTESLLNHMERVGVLFYEWDNETEGKAPGGGGKEGWEVKKLGEVCEIERGGSPRPIQSFLTDDPNGINWIKISDASASEKFIFKTEQKIKKDGVKKSRLVYPGDFLLSNSMSFGRPYIMKTTGCIHDGWLVLRQPKVNQDFLYYLLGSDLVYRQFDGLAAGSTVRNLNINLAASVEIPLPPLSEQKRIVAILDEAFAGIATAKANAEKNLHNARAVFESHLNAVLLNKKWTWKALGEMCVDVEYGSSAKSKKTGEVPVLRMGNIQDGRLDWANLVYTDDKAEIKKYLLKQDDVLFNRTNSPELVGKTAIYKNERPAIFAGYLIRIHRKESLLDADYLTYFLNSKIAFDYGKTVVISSVNQANINGSKLKGYPIPAPTLSEQKTIVAKLDALSAETQRLAGIYERKLAALEALKKSLLQRAFAGEL